MKYGTLMTNQDVLIYNKAKRRSLNFSVVDRALLALTESNSAFIFNLKNETTLHRRLSHYHNELEQKNNPNLESPIKIQSTTENIVESESGF